MPGRWSGAKNGTTMMGEGLPVCRYGHAHRKAMVPRASGRGYLCTKQCAHWQTMGLSAPKR